MAPADRVLVDTSVWVEFFRRPDSEHAMRLDALLDVDACALCGPVYAELISGARNAEERDGLRELLAALPTLDAPEDVWDQVGEVRHALARRGRQASLVDVLIAVIAASNAVPVYTLDADFDAIAAEAGAELIH